MNEDGVLRKRKFYEVEDASLPVWDEDTYYALAPGLAFNNLAGAHTDTPTVTLKRHEGATPMFTVAETQGRNEYAMQNTLTTRRQQSFQKFHFSKYFLSALN